MTAAGGPVPILMYHSVAHAPSRAAHGLSVRPDAFAEQMAVLDAAGFVPLTTRELAAAWRDGRPLPPKPVLITFDDGYEGVHRHALPVLAARGFPSTVFVSTGWLRGEHETGGALDLMLTWHQLRELTEAGAEAGGHSHTHPQLDQLADDRLAFEIERLPRHTHRGTRPAAGILRLPLRLLQPPGCGGRYGRPASGSRSRWGTAWRRAHRARTPCGG
ncbi:hypothetical protein GCM10020221_30140 [Streptomyces thioluteus]|uniref:NodB homology domain-containing protein n=1 Tax=Streptomyces thioluteus TaxID=66431 RepID=A0ABN3X199_STRTU